MGSDGVRAAEGCRPYLYLKVFSSFFMYLPLWCNGSTSAFQAEDAGSIPVSGSTRESGHLIFSYPAEPGQK